MLITVDMPTSNTPTKEELKELEAAAKIPVVYDEDSPKLTGKIKKAFLNVAQKRRGAPSGISA